MRMRTTDSGKPCRRCGAMIRFRRHRDTKRWVAIDYRSVNYQDLATERGRYAATVFRITSDNEVVRVEGIHDQTSSLFRLHRQTCRPDEDPDPRQAVIA